MFWLNINNLERNRHYLFEETWTHSYCISWFVVVCGGHKTCVKCLIYSLVMGVNAENLLLYHSSWQVVFAFSFVKFGFLKKRQRTRISPFCFVTDKTISHVGLRPADLPGTLQRSPTLGRELLEQFDFCSVLKNPMWLTLKWVFLQYLKKDARYAQDFCGAVLCMYIFIYLICCSLSFMLGGLNNCIF